MTDFLDQQVNHFVDTKPENIMRAVVLFGRNAASYKFALAKSLVELGRNSDDLVTLETLAAPFSRHVCEHLKIADRQGTASRSRFLTACRKFNSGQIGGEELIATTIKFGFENVIDAFHVSGSGSLPVHLFRDARSGASPGLVLTPELRNLAAVDWEQRIEEIEGRWRLVETAWNHRLAIHLIEYDASEEMFVLADPVRRVGVAGARSALNGYQKGYCFYCYRRISIVPGSSDLADVDHVLPHMLQRKKVLRQLDGIWNLVLACRQCNRGTDGKFDNLPDSRYAQQLLVRNNYLISSHDPLKDVLINQMGATEQSRAAFIREVFDTAAEVLGRPARWSTPALGSNPCVHS